MKKLEEIIEELDVLSYAVIRGDKQWVDVEMLIRQAYTAGIEAGIRQALENTVIKEFIEGTPAWHKAFLSGYKNYPCIMCGIVPDNLLKLSDAIKSLLKEKV